MIWYLIFNDIQYIRLNSMVLQPSLHEPVNCTDCSKIKTFKLSLGTPTVHYNFCEENKAFTTKRANCLRIQRWYKRKCLMQYRELHQKCTNHNCEDTHTRKVIFFPFTTPWEDRKCSNRQKVCYTLLNNSFSKVSLMQLQICWVIPLYSLDPRILSAKIMSYKS
jgi:hypothetical protein